MRYLVSALQGLVYVLAIASCAGAQENATAAIAFVVKVTDAKTQAPVSLARVIIDGANSAVGYTDRRGIARFERLDPGDVKGRVSHGGYVAAVFDNVKIDGGRETSVDVTLAPIDSPQHIGSVRSHSRPLLSTDSIVADSPLNRLTGGDLLQSLGNGADTSLNNGSLSIDGHDSSQMSVRLDGVQIGGFGNSLDLRGLNVNLFSGASVSSGAGALGGTLDLVTLEPTVLPQTSTDIAYDSADSSSWRSWFRGSIGNVGVVLSHVSSGEAGPVDGRRFLDASGLDYIHRDASATTGSLAKIRVPLSSGSALTFTGLSSAGFADAACLRVTGPLPCGFGPNNNVTSNADLGIAAFRHQHDDVSYSFSVLREQLRSAQDFLGRTLNGVPVPAFSAGSTDITAYTANLSVTKLAWTTAASVSADNVSFRQSMLGPFALAGGGRSASTRADLQLTRHFGDLVDASVKGSYEQNGLDPPLGGGATILWHPNGETSIAMSTRVSGGGTPPVVSGALRDPGSLVYDCPAHAVFGTALGDQPTPSMTSETRLSARRSSPSGSIDLSVWDQVQHGTSLSTIVNGDDGDIPAGYLSSVAAFYATPAGCGVPQALTSQDLYVLKSVSGLTRRYQGIRIAFGRQLGTSLGIGGYARYTSARVISSSELLQSPSSITIPGRQLPNVPELTAGVVADVHAPKSPLEGLVSLQFVGSNNPRNLPPYATVALGASFETRAGSLALIVRNVTTAPVGSFVSSSHAVSLPRVNGSLPTLAQPFGAPVVRLSYSLKTGQGRTAGRVSADQTDTGAQVASALFGGLPASAPEHPFQVDRNNANCNPESVGDAEDLLKRVARAASAIESARVAAAYPEAFDLRAFEPADPRFVYRRTAASYAISLRFKAQSVLGISCVDVVAAGDEQEAQRVGAYSDGSLPTRSIEFAFMPRFGFYAVFHQSLKSPKNRGADSVEPRPSDIFAIRQSCPPSQRPFVEAVNEVVRGILREPFVEGEARLVGDGTKVTIQGVRATPVVQIEFPDALGRVLFGGCIFESRYERQNLGDAVRWSSSNERTVNFLTTLGFYSIGS